ncbi:MAG: squalene--hopene cyclase [Planctomycetes bacterium]|nr:squalene--hopene cyclase [Planctomycetota bacterium]
MAASGVLSLLNTRAFFRPRGGAHAGAVTGAPGGAAPARPASRPRPSRRRRGALADAIARGAGRLLAERRPGGWWCAFLEGDIGLNAEYILFCRFMGLERRRRVAMAARTLLSRQLADGSWPLYGGGPGNLSTTVESYFALKLAGYRAGDERLERAREFIRAHGGVMATRVLTKIYLSYFGQFDSAGIPSVPIEMMFMPRFSAFNIYEFACWARTYTVPLMVLNSKRPVVAVSDAESVDELYLETRGSIDYSRGRDAPILSWRNFFTQVDRLLKVFERHPLEFPRRLAFKRAEYWLLEHQDLSGEWGGIFPAIINSLMALRTLGYPLDHPVLEKGIAALEGLQVVQGDGLVQQPCHSPVWDTAWAVMALAEAGCEDGRPAVAEAVDWLYGQQVRRPGDWSVKNPCVEPGGWPFQFRNDFYPDNDDSAAVLLALGQGPMDAGGARAEAVRRGLAWVRSMQNDDGGWAAFEKHVDNEIYNEIPFNDCKNMLDPSTADVTARVVEMLGARGEGLDDPAVARAVDYLRRAQEADGSWFGRWGVNYVYGTWSVLCALASVGVPAEDPAVRRGVAWLASRQDEDGGFGETCESYTTDRNRAGRGQSTPSQTAWGLMGLVAGGDAATEAARRAAAWLVEAQRSDGDWDEDAWTGTGFPGAFYLRYHLYRLYFPVLALARYRDAGGAVRRGRRA